MSEFVASKTVATTGASRGIGAAAARAFAEAGANVVLMARVGCYLRQAVGRHLVSFLRRITESRSSVSFIGTSNF